VAGGRVEAMVRDNFDVNQSRVFTLQQGDLLLWSSLGNLDAGRGAKTVTGAPPPVFTINKDGQLVVDTSGSFSGSGIAVLDAASNLDLYAPKGEITAGEAGIRSKGNAFLGALVIRNANDIQVSGSGGVQAAPPPPSPPPSLGDAATSAGTKLATASDEDDEKKKKRPRRNLLLDFLGFGPGKAE